MPDQGYGDAKAQRDAQQIAPMAGAQPMPKAAVQAPAQGAGMPAYQGGDFAGPSQRPGEPVTAGAGAGDGPGPEVLTFQPIQPGAGTGAMTSLLQNLSATDTTGILAQLMQAAQARNA